MDAGSTISLLALVGLALAVPISAAEMFKRWLSYKERQLEATRLALLDGAERRAMEQRLAVLERIVTDQGYDVARQIEALRAPTESALASAQTEHA